MATITEDQKEVIAEAALDEALLSIEGEILKLDIGARQQIEILAIIALKLVSKIVFIAAKYGANKNGAKNVADKLKSGVCQAIDETLNSEETINARADA